METVLSSKGQVVIPAGIRRKLKLKPGDKLRIEEDSGKVVMQPETTGKGRLVYKPDEGRHVISLDRDTPLTSQEVEDILNEIDW